MGSTGSGAIGTGTTSLGATGAGFGTAEDITGSSFAFEAGTTFFVSVTGSCAGRASSLMPDKSFDSAAAGKVAGTVLNVSGRRLALG